jgi:hypothetical protein
MPALRSPVNRSNTSGRWWPGIRRIASVALTVELSDVLDASIFCRMLMYVSISSRLLQAVPHPSVRLFFGLCFFAALMMLVLLLAKSTHHDPTAHHESNIAADHS